MTKADLISVLAAKADSSRSQAERFLSTLAEVAVEELQCSAEFGIPGIGKLSTGIREARVGRNPKTGEEIQIPVSTKVKFKAAKSLKDAVV